jgi:hypothetical protein
MLSAFTATRVYLSEPRAAAATSRVSRPVDFLRRRPGAIFDRTIHWFTDDLLRHHFGDGCGRAPSSPWSLAARASANWKTSRKEGFASRPKTKSL